MSGTEPTTTTVDQKSSKSIDQTTKDVIVEIKKKTGAEQLKLVGLFKQLSEVKSADKSFAHKTSKLDYDLHTRTQTLFNEAVQIYKNELPFSRTSITDPSLFFSPVDLSDPTFDTFEAVAPVHPWFKLLTKIDIINSYITEVDEEILKHITKIDVIRHEESENFEIEFHFEQNEFFTNEKLEVEAVCDEDNDDGEPIEEIKSSEIDWKEGKDPRFEEKKTKSKTKKGKKIPGKVVKERVESFFWLFKGHIKQSVDADEDEDDEEGQGGDPLSDGALYGQAADIMELLKKNAFVYAIPAMFGIKIEEFAGLGDIDEDAIQGMQKQMGAAGQKPECKQQ